MADASTVATYGPDHERRILSVCLSDPEKARGPLDELSPGMFSAPVYRRTWAAMLALHERGEKPALCTIIQELRRGGDLGAFGPDGPESVLSLVGVQAHAGDLVDLQEPIARLREAQQKREASAAARHFPTAAETYAKEWSKPAPTLIPTGLAALDEQLGGGLLPASLTVLAAATGRGKSGLAMQLGRAWLHQGRRVFYLHTEMTSRQALARFLAPSLDRPWLDLVCETPADAGASIESAGCYLRGLTSHRWKGCAESLTQIVERFRTQYPDEPLVLIVDHLTDLARSVGAADMRLATQRVTSELKEIAERFDMLVFVVAQTARGVEQPRPGGAKRKGRDFESAAKDAGEVEADASAVLYLQSDPCPMNGSAPAWLHVSKSRGGAVGAVIPLCFHGALGIFGHRPEELTGDELRMLRTIEAQTHGQGFVGIAPLREALQLGQDKCSNLLSRLVDRGLVQRSPRGTHLTAVGHAVLVAPPSSKGQVGPC